MTALRPATAADRPALEEAFAAYRAELARYAPDEFGPAPLEDAWFARPDDLFPYVVAHEGRAVGFCLVLGAAYVHALGGQGDWGVHALWIEPTARRTGAGLEAARATFERHPGAWSFVVLRDNAPALAFWRRAVDPAWGLVVEPPEGPYVRFRFATDA